MKRVVTIILLLTSSLPLWAQTDSTEPVIIDSKKFRIVIYEKETNEDSTDIKIEKVLDKIQIEKVVEIEPNIPLPPKTVETEWHVLELGLNNIVHGSSFEMPAAYRNMELSPAKSINFHWGILQQGINLYQGKWRLLYGVGIEYNNYRFVKNVDLVRDSDPLDDEINTTREYKKNKLVTQYVTVPLMLVYKSKPNDKDHSFRFSAGVQAGYLIGAHQKQKWEQDGKEKRKVRDDFNLSDYRFGYVVQVGYAGFNIYAKYYPTPMFQDNRGPEGNTAAAGLVINPF